MGSFRMSNLSAKNVSWLCGISSVSQLANVGGALTKMRVIVDDYNSCMMEALMYQDTH